MKRFVDIIFSSVALILMLPVCLFFCIFIFLEDFCQPFHLSTRTGRKGKPFTMIKLRSMVTDAYKYRVFSTANDDGRLTRIGKLMRRYKIDELPQLINVLKGDMSIVGPRPNVEEETKVYTDEEWRLLCVRPGITDLASIVFSDEGDILVGHQDPDLAYHRLIRPWKGYLGLCYVDNRTLRLDFKIMFLTMLRSVDESKALVGVIRILENLNAPMNLRRVARRNSPLISAAPPGASHVVTDRFSTPL